jgi:hypothetical protein
VKRLQRHVHLRQDFNLESSISTKEINYLKSRMSFRIAAADLASPAYAPSWGGTKSRLEHGREADAVHPQSYPFQLIRKTESKDIPAKGSLHRYQVVEFPSAAGKPRRGRLPVASFAYFAHVSVLR